MAGVAIAAAATAASRYLRIVVPSKFFALVGEGKLVVATKHATREMGIPMFFPDAVAVAPHLSLHKQARAGVIVCDNEPYGAGFVEEVQAGVME